MPAALQTDESVNLEELSRQCELSAGSIIKGIKSKGKPPGEFLRLNAVLFAALRAYTRNDKCIFQKDLMDGIDKEYLKEDISF